MMAVGDLDRRITVRKRMEVDTDWSGHPIYDVVDFATVSARRVDVSDAEKYAAGRIGRVLLSRFVVRSTAITRQISHIDTLAHDGMEWNIDGIKQARDGRNRFLEITAITGD